MSLINQYNNGFSAVLECIMRFLRNTKGNILILTTSAIVPLIMLVGVGIDYSRVQRAQSTLQNAIDRTAVAIAKIPDYTTFSAVQAKDVAIPYLREHFQNNRDANLLEDTVNVTINPAAGSVQINAQVQVNTSFLQIIGKGSIGAQKSATVSRGSGSIELALVFDTTNSMVQGTNWETATNALRDTLEQLKKISANSNFHISFVPFADRVNVGWDKLSWFSVPPPDESIVEKFYNDNSDLINNPLIVPKSGCVNPREQNHESFFYAVDDDAPTGANLFEPYVGSIITDINGRDYVAVCANELVGPTEDIDTIITAVTNSFSAGTGRFDTALAWGWRVLSPKWRGYWEDPTIPGDYNTSTKIVLFMTDGKTIIYDTEVGGKTGFTTSLGFNYGTLEGFQHFNHLCDRMKAEGIMIFTVFVNQGIGGGNPAAIPYLQNCASENRFFYTINDTLKLVDIFKSLFSEFSDLRFIN